MFDGLLGRGFASKGKPLIKLTKNRIYVLRKKRTATIKFLKKDLADLVINGLDVNAYSRAGGLLDELRHLWNLDFVEKTCDFVYKHLSTMQKMAECPEDCREAVSSLMFAASGFSEFLELRELRQMFIEKYADSLGLYVNQELVESMSSKPFSLEKKVKLMEDITLEFSIHWDSKAFEKRIVRDNSSSVKETSKSTYNGNITLPKREEFNKKTDASVPLFQQNGYRGNQDGLTSKKRSENVHQVSRSESKSERKEFYLQGLSQNRQEPLFNEGDTIVMKIKHENLAQGNRHGNGVANAHTKTEVVSERKELHFQSKQESSRDRHESLAQGNRHGNSVVDAHTKTEVSTSEKLSTKRADKVVLGFKQESFFQGQKHEILKDLEDNSSKPPKQFSKSKIAESTEYAVYKSLPPPYVKAKTEKALNPRFDESLQPPKSEKAPNPCFHESLSPPYVKAKTEKVPNPCFHESLSPPYVEAKTEKAPNPRFDESLLPPYEKASNPRFDDEENDKNPSLKLRNRRKKDNEEKMMDKLLMHYSKKPTNYEESESKRTHLKKDKSEGKINRPVRSHSLPDESSEPIKTFDRALSFQPSEAKHVHPKLPDYDDLAARFAELKRS